MCSSRLRSQNDNIPKIAASYPQTEDVIIAFMGITGSGKSSFIKALTGRTDIVVGDGLESSAYLHGLHLIPHFCSSILTLCHACSNRNSKVIPHHHQQHKLRSRGHPRLQRYSAYRRRHSQTDSRMAQFYLPPRCKANGHYLPASD